MVLADRLRDARRRRFVGRAAELELFEAALETSPFAVLFIHGPGGVGKSALLTAFAEVAARRGIPVTSVDLRAIEVSPPGFEAAVPTPTGRHVLLLDTYEAAAGLDAWLRERYLPALPDEVLVVLAGRDPPATAWRADAGWRELLRVVSLRNLEPADALRCLQVEGVPMPCTRTRWPSPTATRSRYGCSSTSWPRAGRRATSRRRPTSSASCSRGSSPTHRARGTGRRSRSARTPAPPPRTCSARRSTATTAPSCSHGCGGCRSSTKARTAPSRTTSRVRRSMPTCAGAIPAATSSSIGPSAHTSSRDRRAATGRSPTTRGAWQAS